MFKFSMSRLILSISLLSIVNVSSAAYTITPNTINFGTVTSGSDVQPEITIENTGNAQLHIGSIATTPVAPPFSLQNISPDYIKCENTIIQPGKHCSFFVRFSPDTVTEIAYNSNFNIEIINDEGSSSTMVINLNGTGSPAENVSDISLTSSSIDYGVVDVLESELSLPYGFSLFVQNNGNVDMNFLTPATEITGSHASEVTLGGSCPGMTKLEAGFGCNYEVRFKPLSTGTKSATISILTDDPDESPFVIPVTATVVGESDGVLAEIEDAGPNNGDGNYDGILDSKQSNVATFIDSYGNYVTYYAINGARLKNVSVLPSTTAEIPANLTISSGIFDFIVEGVVPGSALEVAVYLPAGINSGAYNMYAATADNPLPHWFNFDFNGETGAFILGDYTFTEYNSTRNLISLALQDGGRGDADMTVNGEIAITSAVSIKSGSSDGGGFIGLLQLLSLASLLILTRLFSHVR